MSNHDGSGLQDGVVTSGSQTGTSQQTLPNADETGTWVQSTTSFSASSASQTLTFVATYLPGSVPEMLNLDGVVPKEVSAVAEPSSWALLVAGFCGARAVARGRRGGDLPAPVSALLHQGAALAATLPQRVPGLVGWLAAMALLFEVLERVRPARSQRFWGRDLDVDLGDYFLSGVVPAFAVSPAIGAVDWIVSGWVPSGFMTAGGRPAAGLRVALLAVVDEAAYDGVHRASHAVPWLWRLRRIHHRAIELDGLVNTRAHPVDLMLAPVVPLVPLLTPLK